MKKILLLLCVLAMAGVASAKDELTHNEKSTIISYKKVADQIIIN